MTYDEMIADTLDELARIAVDGRCRRVPRRVVDEVQDLAARRGGARGLVNTNVTVPVGNISTEKPPTTRGASAPTTRPANGE